LHVLCIRFDREREVPNVQGDFTLDELRHAVPRPLVDDQARHTTASASGGCDRA
jgi:hypothetical protein